MMEVALCAALAVIWWLASVTFALPLLILLKCSKSVRDRWFAFLHTRCILPIFQHRMLPLRIKAFELLKENLSGLDSSKVIKVLEIGIGPGANLQFYPENSHLTALDKNAKFDAYFRSNQKKYQQIVYERTVIGFAEDMKEIDDCSMDLVISTYVLCSVNSTSDALKEVKRVLKPGGRFLFLEHVLYPRSYWSSTVQQMVNPIWKIYGAGCNVIRNTGEDIKNAGFTKVMCENDTLNSVIMFSRAQVYGVAIK